MNSKIIEKFCKTYFPDDEVEFFDDCNFEVDMFVFTEKDLLKR